LARKATARAKLRARQSTRARDSCDADPDRLLQHGAVDQLGPLHGATGRFGSDASYSDETDFRNDAAFTVNPDGTGLLELKIEPILINGPVTLNSNRADRNADLGIEAVPGTLGGGNRANHNGNRAQCVPATLCKHGREAEGVTREPYFGGACRSTRLISWPRSWPRATIHRQCSSGRFSDNHLRWETILGE
jgi:hypothetical protein